jgi:hypothetical protein
MVRKLVLYDAPKHPELVPAADDIYVGSDGCRQLQGPLQQGAAVKPDEGLVRPHAAALAAGQNEGSSSIHGAIIHNSRQLEKLQYGGRLPHMGLGKSGATGNREPT